jgi:hypothetical protein
MIRQDVPPSGEVRNRLHKTQICAIGGAPSRGKWEWVRVGRNSASECGMEYLVERIGVRF